MENVEYATEYNNYLKHFKKYKDESEFVFSMSKVYYEYDSL